jgi:hypothetical protein
MCRPSRPEINHIYLSHQVFGKEGRTCPCTKHHLVKAYKSMKVKLHASHTSTLEVVE